MLPEEDGRDGQESEAVIEPEQQEESQEEQAEEQQESTEESQPEPVAQTKIGYYNSPEEAERGIHEKDRTIKERSEENKLKDAEIARLRAELAKSTGQKPQEVRDEPQEEQAPDPDTDFEGYVKWVSKTLKSQRKEIADLKSGVETKAREIVSQWDKENKQSQVMAQAEQEFANVLSNNNALYLNAEDFVVVNAASNKSDPAHERAVRTMELARLITQNKLSPDDAHAIIESKAKRAAQASKQKTQTNPQPIIQQPRQTIVKREIPQDKSQTTQIKTLDQALMAMRRSVG